MPTETISLGFHGAARTVTGSKYLLRRGGASLLVDCGMFQGLKELRLRNWTAPAFDPKAVTAVALTHTHIDHCGYLPRLVRSGFAGQVLCTPPTADLLPIVLKDAAKLQQEDADFFNKHGLSKHKPAEPLFTEDDVERTLGLLQVVEYGRPFKAAEALEATFLDVGHILGSAMVHVRAGSDGVQRTVLFSGDVGRYDAPLTPDPTVPPPSDYVVVESTYGNRTHGAERPIDELERVVKMVLKTGGVLLVPAFAVGRSQQLLYLLRQLESAGRIPRLPIHVDSPMAFATTEVYLKYLESGQARMDPLTGGPMVGENIRLHKSVEESRRLADLRGPAVVIASSGMLAGGRVLHHLKNFLTREGSVLAIAGYQAMGTRGRLLLDGKRTVKIYGEEIVIRGSVVDMDGFSGHGDSNELMRWLGGLSGAPRKVFVTHGEPDQSAALGERITREKGWATHVPEMDEQVEL
ncbi:MAG: MBL fold metallo-hydrolase [Elusimicrobia bacterium]|nr:MBL fold metallo-hydrolase [Elusimicrobiota bacterium]